MERVIHITGKPRQPTEAQRKSLAYYLGRAIYDDFGKGKASDALLAYLEKVNNYIILDDANKLGYISDKLPKSE